MSRVYKDMLKWALKYPKTDTIPNTKGDETCKSLDLLLRVHVKVNGSLSEATKAKRDYKLCLV